MIKLISAKEYFLYFMCYSIFGWCYEVFLEVFVYRWGYSDRGVLTGPYCPVYGFGAMVFILTVYSKLRGMGFKGKIKRMPYVFVVCSVMATLIELAASYICEFFSGSWPWQTYADYRFNFQARIALSPSIRFGLGGVLFLYVFQPFFENAYRRADRNVANAVTFVVFALFAVDLINLLMNLCI